MININIKMLKLHDWIDINNLHWSELCKNPNAIKLKKSR